MLPRSFFSASSLKSPQTNNNSANSSGDEATGVQQNLTQRSNSEPRITSTRRTRVGHSTSPMLFPNDSDAELDSYISADSIDESSSSDEQNEGTPSNLQDLMLQLQQQQEKQARYVEKTRALSQRMQETSLKIAQLTGMTLPRPSSSNRSQSIRKSDALSTPSHAIDSEGEQPLRRLNYAKRSAGQPRQSSLPPTKIHRQNNHDDPPVPLARKTVSRAIRPSESVSSVKAATPSSSSNTRVQRDEQIRLASQDVCDLYMNRNQDVKTTAFQKKPRSLLFNIAENNSSMSDLMVSTSLKGDMQFWNTSTRSLVKNFGSEQFFKNDWIEEMCWVTPTTLALCMGRSKNETREDPTVHLTHVNKVTKDDVEISVQGFAEKPPHKKEIISIASVQLGQTGSVGVERASFVTGGVDHMVCLWDMIRDSPQEDFALTDINTLGINHTSSVQALCYDTQNDKLYTGGADSKLFTYDMLSQKTVSELKIGNRVNHIQKNPKDHNLLLLTQAQTSEQFAIYDQRMHGVRGLKLCFGFSETENLSRYIKPDWQQNGYIVVCGSQSESKVHFWDIRYSGVGRGPCFSLLTQGGSAPSRVLRTLFLPNRDTLVTVSSTRTLTWTDYTVQPNSRISAI